MNTPLQATNLQGNKVRDLVAALQLLDQDVTVSIVRVGANNGQLRICFTECAFLREVNDACGIDFQKIEQLCDYITDAQNNFETLKQARKLLAE